eukprot:7335922-Pyramimonas_sp.AAC.1
MEHILEHWESSAVGVCADDVGTVLQDRRLLLRLRRVFTAAQALAGLALKLAKCKVVPLNAAFSEVLAANIKEWLALELPGWEQIDVVPFAKYLGYILGPGATIDDAWQEAAAKWIHRIRDLAREGAPVHLTTVIYNSRVLT